MFFVKVPLSSLSWVIVSRKSFIEKIWYSPFCLSSCFVNQVRTFSFICLITWFAWNLTFDLLWSPHHLTMWFPKSVVLASSLASYILLDFSFAEEPETEKKNWSGTVLLWYVVCRLYIWKYISILCCLNKIYVGKSWCGCGSGQTQLLTEQFEKIHD